jgi:hypothetical protein
MVQPALAAPVITIQTPPALIQNGSLAAVSAVSTSEAWAAGSLLAHFDGTTWTPFTIPVANAALLDVTDIASNDAWAVGNVSPVGSDANLVALNWNGTSWSEVATPPPPGLSPFFTSVTSSAANDVWIAGSQVAPDNQHIIPLFEHFDGTAWSIIPASVVQPGFYEIKKITEDGPNDVWAVGSNGINAVESQPVSFHWNGIAWSQVLQPNQPVGAQLNGVVALSPTNAWAVGSVSRKTINIQPQGDTANPLETLTEHWDGTKWSVVASQNLGPAAANESNHLQSVVALSPTDLYAVGFSLLPDGSGHVLTFALHGDGTSWTLQPTPDVSLQTALSGAAAAQPSTVWFVGAAQSAGTFGAPLIVGTNGG